MSKQDLPPLFGRKGEWLGYDATTLEQLSPDRVALYHDLEAAARQCAAAESELKAAHDRVADCVARVREAEGAMPKRMTHHELWRGHFGRPRHAL